jgi:hypothetical protein
MVTSVSTQVVEISGYALPKYYVHNQFCNWRTTAASL